MVDLHNQARAGVNPPAKSMPQMTWDSTIANFAIAYTSLCHSSNSYLLDHNPNRVLSSGEYLGENLWASTGTLEYGDGSIEAAVRGAMNGWVEEASEYNYATNTCSTPDDCGHYTQIVWATSIKFGCALVLCPNLMFKATLLCDYGPGGNYVGEQPYVAA